MKYFSGTPVSYMYTNSIELVPRFCLLSSPVQALSNRAIPKLNFPASGRISVVMSTFSVFGLSSNEFCTEEGQNPTFDPLPCNEKLCGNL